MQQAIWIGGPPAAGKTTIARRLTRRYGLRLYSADTRTWVHRDRALQAGLAAAQRWEGLAPADRWRQSTDELLAMSLHDARGQMVIDDVASLPASPLTVAEGSTLPAWAISAKVVQRSRALWLLPTAEFQEAQFGARRTEEGPAELARLLRLVAE